INEDEIDSKIIALFKFINEMARRKGINILWTMQQKQEIISYNKFFIGFVFPELLESFYCINSLHLHFELALDIAFDVYNGLNKKANEFIDNTNINYRKRYAYYQSLRARVMGPLMFPYKIYNLEDFDRHLNVCRAFLERVLIKRGKLDNARVIFPKYFKDGSVFIGPDKLYTLTRLRPDLKTHQDQRENISVEFRPILGSSNVENDIENIKKAIRYVNEIIESKKRNANKECNLSEITRKRRVRKVILNCK
ncbi:MAG: hypothetical protein QXI89_01345, partial [Candidatus Anstonellales archaeon]